MKKLVTIKLTSLFLFFGLFFLMLIVIVAICGGAVAGEIDKRNLDELRNSTSVINNFLYADRYRSLLNKYLFSNGYVPLERLVFYLQRTNNILDTSTLSYEKWEESYLINSDSTRKQMIPIKTICKNLKADTSLPAFTIVNGKNANDVYIDKIDLCFINGIDVAESDDYNDSFLTLPYSFPLEQSTLSSVTSMVFEQRDVDLDISEEQQKRVNFHSGWDFGASATTNVYSICSGTVTAISFTQSSNVPYNEQSEPRNGVGNYIHVLCDGTGDTVLYYHLYPNSYDHLLRLDSNVKKGQFFAKVGTTGLSTGNHLHLGLKTYDGVLLDALAFIDFSTNYNNEYFGGIR